MTNAENKTKPTGADVLDFLATIESSDQRKESETLITLMTKIAGEPPVMWGPSIIGFGSHHYKYDSGREGDAPDIGFSPRKGKFALYVVDDATMYPDLINRLGKHTAGKACIYINKLSDIDMAVLEELITLAHQDTKVFYNTTKTAQERWTELRKT